MGLKYLLAVVLGIMLIAASAQAIEQKNYFDINMMENDIYNITYLNSTYIFQDSNQVATYDFQDNSFNGSGNFTTTGYGRFLWVDKPESAEDSIATPSANILRIYVEDFKGFSFYKYIDDTGMVRQLARDNVFVGKNEGSEIPKMSAVYDCGSSGNVPLLCLAKADNSSTMPAIGIAVEAIGTGSYGRVMMVGLLEHINTNSFTEGDMLFVSETTAGEITDIAPITPNLTQEIGTVLVKSVGAGSIQVISRALTGDEYGTMNDFTVQGNITSTADYWCNSSDCYNISDFLVDIVGGDEVDPYWTGNQSLYFTKTEIDSFDFWNDTYATFNKTYGDTLYAPIAEPLWRDNQSSYFTKTEIDSFEFWNSTLAYFNKTYADTLYAPVSEPYWTDNQSSYYTKSDIDGFLFYNSSDFDISDYYTISQIDGFSFYNDSDFDIADYSTTSDMNTAIGNANTSMKDYADNTFLTAEADTYWTGNYTACPAGNHLYFDGGNLACEADQVGGGGTGAPHWVDNGTFLSPNSSYAININVQGYIEAANWTGVNTSTDITNLPSLTILESQISDLGTYLEAEVDPFWTANMSDYWTIATIAGFGFYNDTDFDIGDYFTKAEIDGFGYWNESGDVAWTDLTDDGTFTDTKYCTYDSGNSRIDCNSEGGSGGWTQTATSDLNMSDYDILNASSVRLGHSEGDSYIYFYEDGSVTGESIVWSNSIDRFNITDSVHITGELIATSQISSESHVLAQGNLYSSSDIFTTGSGNDLWLGAVIKSSAKFQASADGSLNISSGAFEVTATGEVQVGSGQKVCLDGATCSTYVWNNGSVTQIVG